MENKEIINTEEKKINEEVLEEVSGGVPLDRHGKQDFSAPFKKDAIDVTSETL